MGRLNRWLSRRRPVPESRSSACFAPHSALYFEPAGRVQACCATGWVVGTVTGPSRRSIGEIWNGLTLRDQRARLEEGGFDLGCQECELAIAASGRGGSLASHFDVWGPGSPHRYPLMMDFALSNRCNLECVMCNGDLSSTIRARREGRPPLRGAYDDEFFDQLLEFLPHLRRAQFKGGEPFLAPENRRVWEAMLELGVACDSTVTTNGTVWNDDVARWTSLLRLAPNVSVDGMSPGTFESIRLGANFERVWRNIDRFQQAAESNGTGLTLSFCFMTANWHELPEFLLEVERRRVNCYVILVNQPHRYDVLRLPPAELDRVRSSLAARAPALGPGIALDEWNRVLGRLAAQQTAPTQLAVRVRAPKRITAAGAAEVARLRAVAADGPPLAEFIVADGVVTEVTAPDWAGWLDMDAWVGVPLTDLPGVLERVGGGPADVKVDPGVDGVMVVGLSWPDHCGRPALRVHVVQTPDRDDGAAMSTVLIGIRADGGSRDERR